MNLDSLDSGENFDGNSRHLCFPCHLGKKMLISFQSVV